MWCYLHLWWYFFVIFIPAIFFFFVIVMECLLLFFNVCITVVLVHSPLGQLILTTFHLVSVSAFKNAERNSTQLWHFMWLNSQHQVTDNPWPLKSLKCDLLTTFDSKPKYFEMIKTWHLMHPLQKAFRSAANTWNQTKYLSCHFQCKQKQAQK